VKRTHPPLYPEHPIGEHKWRVARARRFMEEKNLGALMLATNIDVFYLTGTRFVFVESEKPSILAPQSATIVTPDDVVYCGRFGPFDSDSVGLDTSLVDNFEYYDEESALVDILKKYGVAKGDRIGTEWGQGGHCVGINPITFEALRKRVSHELGAEFVDATTVIWKMRSVKSNLEIERMRKAVAAAARAMERVFDIIEVGMNELDVARKASIFMLQEGGDQVTHNQVMARGEGPPFLSCAALDRKIEKGYVSLDIGCKYMRYGSDINRGVMLGRQPTPEEKKLYECRTGYDELMERAIRPGVSMDEVLAQANEYVREHGCEMQDMDGGHGIGLDIHEKPCIMTSASQPEFQNKDGKVLFETGMMFTLEPAIKLPGSDLEFNVEDDVVVTDTGLENMNSMLSRELRVKL
jgi:Xaa-Pro aminopeptidase